MLKGLNAFTLLFTMSSLSAVAQGLPDEINYSPYQADYEDVRDERDGTQLSLEDQRALRAALLQAIDDQLLQVSSLETQIDQFNQRIGYINAEIPRLQAQKRRLDRDISGLQNLLRSLRDDMGANNREIQQREQRLVNVKKNLQKERRSKDIQKNKVNALKSSLTKLENEVKTTQDKLAANKTKIQKLKSDISNFDKLLTDKKADLAKTKQSLTKLQKRKAQNETAIKNASALNKTLAQTVKDERALLKKLKQEGASKEEIKKQQSVVQAALADLRANQTQIKKLAEAKKTIAQNISNTTTKISGLEKFINSAPQELAAMKNERKKLVQENTRLAAQISAKTKLVASKKQELKKERQILADIQAELDRLNNRVAKIETAISDFRRANRRLAQTLNTNQRELDQMVRASNQLRDNIVALDSELPVLDRNISQNRSDISRTNSQIAADRATERETYREIKKLENIVRVLTDRTNNAYAQYTDRLNLYNQYLQEAKDLGVSQIGPSINSGRELGYDLSNDEAKSYGLDMAQKVGKAQAKMIGLIRGELEGYKVGYDNGYASSETIERATIIGTQKGKEQAYAYARQVFKPKYFEGFIQDMISNSKKKKSATHILIPQSIEKTTDMIELVESQVLQVIDDITQNEISQSRNLNTSLDSSIETALSSLSQVESLKADLARPSSVYQAPTSIPYTSYDCAGVYKSVAVFKEACSSSFKASFKKSYLFEVKAEFNANYPVVYNDTFNANEPSVREENFDATFTEAFQIAENEGLTDGKEDIYNVSYKKAFDDAYALNMEAAKLTAKNEAKVEVQTWISKAPIVTVKGASFTNPTLRGGDIATIKIDLKNISNVDALKSGIVKIKSAKNLEFSKNIFTLGKTLAEGSSIVELSAKVNTNASSSDYIGAQLLFELPGDKYQQIRVENQGVNQKLALNPKAILELDYDATPNIKGVFRYYRHTFTVKASPAVENLRSKYTITLKATDDTVKHIKQKKTTHTTSVLRLGATEDAKFDYVLNKSADGQEVKLIMTISYENRILKQEEITLRPH